MMATIPQTIAEMAEAVLAGCRAHGVRVATAESCTGGLIAGALTELSGSSDMFERGFVTYSNEAKHDSLGVPHAVIERCGAVSREVAELMAKGALTHSRADIALAVTGIAGPLGGTAEKPVGTVHIALAGPGAMMLHERCLFGDPGRSEIRRLTIERAFSMLQQALTELS